MGLFSILGRYRRSLGKARKVRKAVQKIIAYDQRGMRNMLNGAVLSDGDERTRAVQEYLDLCESFPDVKFVMELEGISRSDLENWWVDLVTGGAGETGDDCKRYALATMSIGEPLQYLARAEKRGVDWGEIVFNLREYWSGNMRHLSQFT